MSDTARQRERGDWILVLTGAVFGWAARKVFSRHIAKLSGAGSDARDPDAPEMGAVRDAQSEEMRESYSGGSGPAKEVSGNSAVILVVCVFLLSIAAAIAFLVAYWMGARHAFLGGAIALSMGAFGAGLVIWAHALMSDEQVSEERELLPSPAREREEAAEVFVAERAAPRRKVLVAMSLGVAGTFVAAVVSLLRSFAEPPGPVLSAPIWRRGDRLVTTEGRLVNLQTLRPGSTVSVFPENRVGQVNAQAVLVRVDEQLLRLPKARAAWAPQGYLAYSRVCTHAGCSVGLYEAEMCLLQCPCHQSTFDVLSGAPPTGGPAARALPQLPLYADADGNLRTGGDFSETPGPGFWGLR